MALLLSFLPPPPASLGALRVNNGRLVSGLQGTEKGLIVFSAPGFGLSDGNASRPADAREF